MGEGEKVTKWPDRDSGLETLSSVLMVVLADMSAIQDVFEDV